MGRGLIELRFTLAENKIVSWITGRVNKTEFIVAVAWLIDEAWSDFGAGWRTKDKGTARWDLL